ncbi:MAG: hypothetical protein GY928_17005 [Colwellia sp.]|nr:hypothetical protein [Colwellia sp.]
MPRKVSDLEVRNRVDLTVNHQVLAADPTNNDLHRVPVSNFRGAGNFNGTTAPPTTPAADTGIPAFIQNDTYTMRDNNGLTFFIRGESDWGEGIKLNGTRVLTASDFAANPELDLEPNSFVNDNLFEGDMYLNRTLDLLFTPYTEAVGFMFGDNNFQGYQAYRPPVTFTMTGLDLIGYTNPATYLQRVLATVPDGDRDALIQALRMRKPIHGDRYHITIEDDEGHGGYVYTFDGSNLNNTMPMAQMFNTALGNPDADGSGRVPFRDATTFNMNGVPLQNDKKYRAGDNVVDVDSGMLYSGYVEGLADDATTDEYFTSSVNLGGGTVIHDIKEVYPVKESSYALGDYVITTSDGTPRMHGAYLPEEATDVLALPLLSILRPPVEHVVSRATDITTLAETTFTADYPFIGTGADRVMVVQGDTLRYEYSDSKSYKSRTGVLVDLAAKTLDWGIVDDPLHAGRVTESGLNGLPAIDDLIYYNNETVRNLQGDSFRYVEKVGEDSEFILIDGGRPRSTLAITVNSGSYEPTTDNSSSEWGGGELVTGDELSVSYNAMGSTKRKIWTVLSSTPATVQWSAPVNPNAGEVTLLNEYNDPATDVNHMMRGTGEHVESMSGIRYTYNDSGPDHFAWTIFTPIFTRAPTVFNIEGNQPNTYVPVVTNNRIDGGRAGAMPQLQAGDKVICTVATTEGVTKRFAYDVVTSPTWVLMTKTPAVLGERYNPDGVRFFASSEMGAGAPAIDDDKYSTGDYIDKAASGWRYIYQEAEGANPATWTQFIAIGQGNPIVTMDGASGLQFSIQIDEDRRIYLKEL